MMTKRKYNEITCLLHNYYIQYDLLFNSIKTQGKSLKKATIYNKRRFQTAIKIESEVWWMKEAHNSHLEYKNKVSTRLLFHYLSVNWGITASEPKNSTSSITIKISGTTYSQTRILCSRPICSLPGLQGQKPKAHYYFTFWDSTIFAFYEIFVGSTSSEVQHPSISKIRCEPKKSRKNKFSGSILKYFWSIDLYEISHGLCNLLEFKFGNL